MGRECHLARLGQKQMEMIEDLCKSHEHEVGGQLMLLVADVSHMLKMLLGVEMDFAINDAVTHAWGQETWPDTHVTHEQFAGIVSWYVKRRERDWKVLEGIFDLLGHSNLIQGLNCDNLQDCRNRHSDDCLADTTENQEMLWAADWIRRGQGGGDELDTCSLLTVFLTNLQRGKGRLPPKCVLDSEGVRPKRAWDRHRDKAMRRKDSSNLSRQSFSRHISPEKESVESEGPEWARCVLDHFERPNSSKSACVVVYFMNCVTVVSVLCIILEPMISGRTEEHTDEEYRIWLGFDIFFAAAFTIELLARLMANIAIKPGCGTFWDFFTDPMNLLDFIAVTEIYLDHLIRLPILRTLLLERFARLSRVVKLCKLKTCALATGTSSVGNQGPNKPLVDE
ncbi:unnamed protein product [Effrenium voratum]|nr:unnamed protein product [Effrenium voratum]